MSTLLGKLKNKSPFRSEAPQPSRITESHSKSEHSELPQFQETHLRSLSETQLRDLFTPLSEREAVRVLRSLSDTELQIKVLKGISNEATLKRVARSDVGKKLKRTAEKMLRDTGAPSESQKLQKLSQLSDQIEVFIRTPDWTEARSLLNRAMTENLPDKSGPSATSFLELKKRLKAQIEEFEKTCAEMEAICDKISPNRSLSRRAYDQLRDRWKDLEAKYSFPKTFEALELYEKHIQLRASASPVQAKPNTPRPAADAGPDPLEAARVARLQQEQEELEKDKERRAKKEQEGRKKRADFLDEIFAALQAIDKSIDDRNTGNRLRQLQAEIADLRRWRREFAGKLEETEALHLSLTSKRSQVISEGQWDAWARTDRATRIQSELEKSITELEAELNQEAAIKLALGLGQRLFDFSKEMRELGTLEREKDHKIWEQFKALTDRGWVICDKIRSPILEELKTLLSAHTTQPIDFSVASLTSPRISIEFKPSAFDASVTERVKELKAFWSEIGAKPSDANREAEIIFAKLFELYFRQVNLHLGQIQRTELKARQLKQGLLLEMKRTCEGRIAPLILRVRGAKSLELKWKRDSRPEFSDLDSEFSGYQSALRAEVATELEKLLTQIAEIETKALALVEKLSADAATKISYILKSIASLEGELLTFEKSFTQLKEVDDAVAQDARFKELRDQVKAALSQAKAAADRELAARSGERNQLLQEAELLALSTDWETSRTRFEELKPLWKKANAIGQKEDSDFDILFEHMMRFYQGRAEGAKQAIDSDKKEKLLKRRKELLLSLEALTRFMETTPGTNSTAARLPLPLDEVELSKAAGKVLEIGLKYKQVLSFDPQGGILKEAKKVMTEWAQLGQWDTEELPAFWAAYLNRIRLLLKVLR